jgi:hypothetical protein
MGNLERNIQLYSLSSNLVQPYIDRLEVYATRSDIARKLHKAIRHEISSGVGDPVKIAENAVRSVQGTYRQKEDELRAARLGKHIADGPMRIGKSLGLRVFGRK